MADTVTFKEIKEKVIEIQKLKVKGAFSYFREFSKVFTEVSVPAEILCILY